MEYEAAYQRICERIAMLAREVPLSSARTAGAAALVAQRDLTAAFRRAAGRPADALWSTAFASLCEFLALYDGAHTLPGVAALQQLRSFVEENGDSVVSTYEMPRAS